MDDTQQRSGATPAHKFCPRMDRAGEGIDGDGQYFRFGGRPAVMFGLCV